MTIVGLSFGVARARVRAMGRVVLRVRWMGLVGVRIVMGLLFMGVIVVLRGWCWGDRDGEGVEGVGEVEKRKG